MVPEIYHAPTKATSAVGKPAVFTLHTSCASTTSSLSSFYNEEMLLGLNSYTLFIPSWLLLPDLQFFHSELGRYFDVIRAALAVDECGNCNLEFKLPSALFADTHAGQLWRKRLFHFKTPKWFHSKSRSLYGYIIQITWENPLCTPFFK